MSTAYGITGFRQTAAFASLRVASRFMRLRNALRERCRCQRVQLTLRGLSDRELMDIGTTRAEIDRIASQRNIAQPDRSASWHCNHTLRMLLLCNAFILALANSANAQCTAQDVLLNHSTLKMAAPARSQQSPVTSAADVPLWKTIAIGTFRDSLALRNAMSAVGCEIGNSAAEILARPAFTLANNKADAELVALTAADLGIRGETASLRQIYAVAQRFGFGLAPAEIAPQLRLQYLDQPIGEFLIIGMDPISTRAGEPVILTVANGGAGLILISQDGHGDAEISVTSRFVFVRPRTTRPAEAAALAK
jgi:uncharacterized protein YjiS (DUF1127 family)